MVRSHLNSSKLEARAFRLNVLGTLAMAIIGLGCAVITKSEAILLDGFFSLIGFVIALLTQKVGRLVMRPGDERYPFGYAVFEPLLSLMKGLIIGLVSLFAMVSAISALLSGGRPISATVAIVYAGSATVGCFLLAWQVGILARRTGSALVAIDAQSWIIDALISAAVTVAFLIVQATRGTPMEMFSPYVDPMLVIILVIATIFIPIKIVREAWKQIVGYRTDASKIAAVQSIVAEAINDNGNNETTQRVRAVDVGRFLYVEVYIIVDLDNAYGSLAQQDRFRDRLYSQLAQRFTYIHLDVAFTQQQKWLYS